MDRKFKVGDKVRYKGLNLYCDIRTNDIKTVREITGSGNGIYLEGVYGWLENELFELVKEKNNMEEKQFHELEEGKQYRLLHGGERDHGYIYEIRDGKLFNKIKGRFSSVPFNNKVRFVESITKKFNLSTLEFDVIFGPRQAKIGCQTISKEDLLEFSRLVQDFYGV